MPKMKTHKGTAKRFRKTGTGKLVRQQANRRHIMEKKPTKRTRRLDGRTDVAPADVPASRGFSGSEPSHLRRNFRSPTSDRPKPVRIDQWHA